MAKHIVVGIDGSTGSIAAAQYAAEIAERRHATLELIHVRETLFYGYGPLGFAAGYATAEERLRESATKLLEETVDKIESVHPAVKIESRLETGQAAERLIDESSDAQMTVVGSRGLGGFASLMLGSVSTQVAAYGHGPILVVRPAADPDGPIVVGVDGSTHAMAALRFAAQEAVLRNAALAVVNFYWEQPWETEEQPGADPQIAARHRAEQLISDALRLPLNEHPDLRCDIRTIHSINPAHSMVEESAHASLTVVGSRGLGGFTGLLLGSVSRTLIHHAAGPLVVVHPAQH